MTMARSIIYRGCTCTETQTTTDVTRVAFGRPYRTVARVWSIEGRHEKSALVRPFLASAADCRLHIRERDAAECVYATAEES
jgi:hypothetical protein